MLKYIDYLPLMFRGRFPSFEIFKDAVVSQLVYKHSNLEVLKIYNVFDDLCLSGFVTWHYY